MSKPLKLIAQSPEDLTVISALLQDMTVRLDDMDYSQAERRFALVGNRFRWEEKRWFRRPKGERVRTGIHFAGVSSVQQSGFDTLAKDTVLELLDMEAHETGIGVIIHLNFAGGAAVRLSCEVVDAVASDLTESWAASARPKHDL